jgi:hypothetical protein
VAAVAVVATCAVTTSAETVRGPTAVSAMATGAFPSPLTETATAAEEGVREIKRERLKKGVGGVGWGLMRVLGGCDG